MSSIYPVSDDDEQRIFKKDKSGNFYEVSDEEDEESNEQLSSEPKQIQFYFLVAIWK